jgi:hypothetical protein
MGMQDFCFFEKCSDVKFRCESTYMNLENEDKDIITMILEFLDSKCEEEAVFYDLGQDDKTFTILNPPNIKKPGFFIRFSNKEKVKYYALLYFSEEAHNNIYQLLKYKKTFKFMVMLI